MKHFVTATVLALSAIGMSFGAPSPAFAPGLGSRHLQEGPILVGSPCWLRCRGLGLSADSCKICCAPNPNNTCENC
ncbi:unnamed protein product [Tilletia controversa]|nr:unnamed protein product [Tilletia controversa]